MMSLPSTEALTIGWRFSASAAALTKKLMKPSLMPCSFWNASPSDLRIFVTSARFTSLNEVSMAIEFFDCIRRSAMRRRMRVIGTRAAALAVVEQVFLGHAAIAAGAGDLGRVDLFLGGDAQAGRGKVLGAFRSG